MGFIKDNNKSRQTEGKEQDSNVIDICCEIESLDRSVLYIGMVSVEKELDWGIVQKYVDFLVENGVIEFTGDVVNGSLCYRIDILGNDLVKVLITMKDGEKMKRKKKEKDSLYYQIIDLRKEVEQTENVKICIEQLQEHSKEQTLRTFLFMRGEKKMKKNKNVIKD